MNKKIAKRLSRLAEKLSTIKEDVTEEKTLSWGKMLGKWVLGKESEEIITWHTYRYKKGTAKFIYKQLKKAYLKTPKNVRTNWLLEQEKNNQ